MMHDFANSAFPRAGAAFSDMHIALAQTVAGNDAALEARARQMDELARKGRYPSGPCIPAVSHAFAAFERRECRTMGEDNRLSTHARVRAFLENAAKRQIPITYQELAKALQILPPHSIHQVTEILERLMEEDAAADRPFIAALAISKARGGLPAAGFFQCARRLGRFAGDPHGQDAWSFHAAELNAVFARWGGSRDN
jgi:hypothetical protein